MLFLSKKCTTIILDDRKNERKILDVSFISDDESIDMIITKHEQLNPTSKEQDPRFVNLTVPIQQEVSESLECVLIPEIREKMNLRDKKLEKQFLKKNMTKLNNDIRENFTAKKSAVTLLQYCFDDSVEDYIFI